GLFVSLNTFIAFGFFFFLATNFYLFGGGRFATVSTPASTQTGEALEKRTRPEFFPLKAQPGA
ncbi:hypothetical protein, partial [Burkholderia stagnalis]|uniref:hypothetical protein n=1 Tax=Burkholderia stagnalis TaxID=1503054 RepID=UPI001C899CDA